MMATSAMHVSMLHLFGSRGAYVGDLDVEVQILAGKWMVAVHGDHVAGDARHRHAHRTLRTLSLEAHAGLDVLDALKRAPWHLLDQRVIAFAVVLGRHDLGGQLVAGLDRKCDVQGKSVSERGE